jgi:hypothetical protein
MKMNKIFAFAITAMLLFTQVDGGLIAYGICQTVCNVIAVGCYAVNLSLIQSSFIHEIF